MLYHTQVVSIALLVVDVTSHSIPAKHSMSKQFCCSWCVVLICIIAGKQVQDATSVARWNTKEGTVHQRKLQLCPHL